MSSARWPARGPTLVLVPNHVANPHPACPKNQAYAGSRPARNMDKDNRCRLHLILKSVIMCRRVRRKRATGRSAGETFQTKYFILSARFQDADFRGGTTAQRQPILLFVSTISFRSIDSIMDFTITHTDVASERRDSRSARNKPALKEDGASVSSASVLCSRNARRLLHKRQHALEAHRCALPEYIFRDGAQGVHGRSEVGKSGRAQRQKPGGSPPDSLKF